MLDSLENYCSSGHLPVALLVFLLGVLATFNPCQLAIHFSALTYLLRRSGNGGGSVRSVWFYSVGRAACYAVMGVLLLFLLRRFGGEDLLERVIHSEAAEWIERLLPIVLVAIALVFFVRAFHHHHAHEHCHGSRDVIKRDGRWGGFVLGAVLALAFCPESALMYFGMMLPLSVPSAYWALLPCIYAVGAALPIAVAGWLMQRSQRVLDAWAKSSAWIYRVSNVLFGIAMLVFAWLIFAEN